MCLLDTLKRFVPVILCVLSFHLSLPVQSRDRSYAFPSSVEIINPSVFSRTSIICLSVIKILHTGKCQEKGSRLSLWTLKGADC